MNINGRQKIYPSKGSSPCPQLFPEQSLLSNNTNVLISDKTKKVTDAVKKTNLFVSLIFGKIYPDINGNNKMMSIKDIKFKVVWDEKRKAGNAIPAMILVTIIGTKFLALLMDSIS